MHLVCLLTLSNSVQSVSTVTSKAVASKGIVDKDRYQNDLHFLYHKDFGFFNLQWIIYGI